MSNGTPWERLDGLTYNKALLDWHRKMYEVYQTMPEEEKQALQEWEQANLDGHSVATSDWPGWVKYIGPPPTTTERN